MCRSVRIIRALALALLLLPSASGAQAPARHTFSAQDALDWGVVNKVCAPDKLMEETLATAQTICDNAPISVRYLSLNDLPCDIAFARLIDSTASVGA